METNYSLSDIATASGSESGFGENVAWWIIILFLFVFMGGGGMFGANNATTPPQMQAVVAKLRGILIQ